MHAENNLSPEDRQGIENAVLAKKGMIPDWIVNFDRQNLEDLYKDFQTIKNTSDRTLNAINSYSKQYAPEPIARKIRIVTKPTGSTLKIMDYSLEYVLNGERSIAIKAVAEGVETVVYTAGVSASAAIAGVVALVGILCPDLAPLAAFGAFMIFNKGEELSYYISQKAKDITIDFFNEKIEYFPQIIDLGNGQYYRNDKDIGEILNSFSLSLFTPHPYPSYSKEYKFALAKKKELITKTSIASNSYNFTDEEYLKNIQDLQEQDQIINQEEQKYQLALKLYKEDNKIKNEIFNPLFKTLNENLSFQLKQERNTFLNPNQSLSIIATKKYSLKTLNLQDIDNININSEFAYLRALFLCESFLVLDNNDEALLNEKIAKEILEYDEDEYILFILHKDKLNDTYLQARKELYKSINEFKRLGFKDLENAYQTYINSLLINEKINSEDETTNENKEINKNLNQDENSNQESNTKENTSNTKEQDFNLLSSHSKNLNHFILENKDKNKRIIFLNNASSMSNLIHIYDNHCDVFIKNNSLLDIKRIEKEYDIKFKEFSTRVFFYEKLLLGAKENNEFSFEDKKENLLYHFKYDKEDLSSLGDLSIKYNNYNARIKNYSSDYCKYYCKIA